MIIVGLTGGIGSGKTTVANMFRGLGVPVYDSDGEAKKLMNSSKKLRKTIVELLGEQAYVGKELNRGYVASKVFSETETLEKLNAIVHPAVRKHFIKWVKKQTSPYVIQESALIFENNNQKFYDYIILVTAPIEKRIIRVLKRDTTTKEDVLSRINNQLLDSEKEKLAHFILINDDLSILELKTREIHSKILDKKIIS